MTKEELAVEVANARLDAAKAKAVRAEREWARAQALVPHNAISGTELDQAECNHMVAQAELREATANVKIAELGLPKAGAVASQGGAAKARRPSGGSSDKSAMNRKRGG